MKWIWIWEKIILIVFGFESDDSYKKNSYEKTECKCAKSTKQKIPPFLLCLWKVPPCPSLKQWTFGWLRKYDDLVDLKTVLYHHPALPTRIALLNILTHLILCVNTFICCFFTIASIKWFARIAFVIRPFGLKIYQC